LRYDCDSAAGWPDGAARFVGADVVEVAASNDHTQLTGIAAANVIYELVCLVAPDAQAVSA